MKYKHIAIALIALSLIAFAFVATVAATIYSPYMYVDRKGKICTFTIDTTDIFDGRNVEKGSILITIWLTARSFLVIYPEPSSITLTYTSITIQMVKQDLPKTALASSVNGTLSNGVDTFFASGPGWVWANVH